MRPRPAGGRFMSNDVIAMRWSAKRPLIIGAVALLILMGGFGTWSFLAQIQGAILTRGQIEVDRNRQIVQHPQGGVVAEIIVDEGDTVNAGDLLLRFDASTVRSELAVVEGQLFEILARRARFEAERDDNDTLTFSPLLLDAERNDGLPLREGQARLFLARAATRKGKEDQLHLQSAQVADQVGGIVAQLDALNTQRALIRRELANQQSLLDRGLAQTSRILALQREEARLLGASGELTARRAQAAERIIEIDLQILDLASTRREFAIGQLRDLRMNELALTERRQTLQRQIENLSMRAPVSGVVYGLQVYAERSVIKPADPLMFIVPQDRPLMITSQVDVADVDQVFVVQDVSVRIAAFDQRRTPELDGKVTLLSADAFRDGATGDSYYRAEVRLEDEQFYRLPGDLTLIPGMQADVFIRTAAHSPIEYLIKPLADYLTKAFREQ